MVTSAENAELVRAWFAAMNARDAKRMGALCAPGVSVREVAEGEEHQGRDYLVWAYEDLFNGYPDAAAQTLNEFAGDDQVLVEVRWTGTNRGEFRGEPATGGTNDVRIAYIFRVEDGAITRITEYYDMHTVMTQLEETAPE